MAKKHNATHRKYHGFWLAFLDDIPALEIFGHASGPPWNPNFLIHRQSRLSIPDQSIAQGRETTTQADKHPSKHPL